MKNYNSNLLIIILITLIITSCAGPLYISEEKWNEKHYVFFKLNQKDVTITNKKQEQLKLYAVNDYTAVYIPKLRPKNLKLKISHPERMDTIVNIKRGVRAGVLIFDCTIGLALYGLPIIVDFANANIYQIKKSSRVKDIKMRYNDEFYTKKFNETERLGSIKDYKEFILKYPESSQSKKAQEQIYAIAWQKAKQLNTINDYEDFINNYSNAPKVKEAQSAVYDLGFKKAVSLNTPEAYDEYISKYPNSTKIEEAKKNKIKVKEIDDAYANAIKTNRYNNYKSFLENYGETKYNSEIAEKMSTAYYEDNKSNIQNLNQCNDAITLIKDIKNKYYINARILNVVELRRDEFIAEEIKKVKSKSDYFSLLINQYNIENNRNDGSDYNATSIANRVISNKSNMNGTYNFWQSNGAKENYTFSNGLKNGAYIKTSEDEKITLEKGNFLNGNKNGNFIINYENGKKQFEQNWKNGSLESETEYDEYGKNLTAIRQEEEKRLKEEEYNGYVQEGNSYYGSKDFENAMNSYLSALRIKEAKEIREKYDKAKKSYDFQNELNNIIEKQKQKNVEFYYESDLILWLEGKTFSGQNGVRIKIDRSGIYINNTQKYFNLSFIILNPKLGYVKGQSLINPDGVIKIYIYPSDNAIKNEGDYFYAE